MTLRNDKEPRRRGQRRTPGRLRSARYGVLDDLVGFAIQVAQTAVISDFTVSVPDPHITPARFAALVIIAENEGMSQNELARVLGIARSGAMAMIRKLIEMGFVKQTERANDKRSLRIELLPAGRIALEAIIEQVREHDRRITSRLDDHERRILVELLRKITIRGADDLGNGNSTSGAERDRT